MLFFILDLNDVDATTYLSPFLEIIKSEETNGPITGLALSSIDKFISYGLIGNLKKYNFSFLLRPSEMYYFVRGFHL
jgi:hypothetical protein